MAFDPDAYLATSPAAATPPAAAGFDPDAYLAAQPAATVEPPALATPAATPEPAPATPGQDFNPDAYLAKPARNPEAVAKALAQVMTAGTPMPAALAVPLLTKGGRAGDIAAEVVPAIGGGIIGTALEPGAGTAAGGAIGGAAGNVLKQARELVRGDRQEFGPGEALTSAAAAAIPVPGLKPAGSVLGTVGKTLLARGAQGAAVAGATETARQLIDEPQMDPTKILESTVGGGVVGAVLGGAEGAVNSGAVRRLFIRGQAADVPEQSLPGAIRAKVEADAPAGTEAAPSARPSAEPLPPGPEGSKPLGFVESAKASPEIAPELREGIAGFYEPQSNSASYQEAGRLIDMAGDLQTAKAHFMGEQNPDAVTSAMGLELVRKFQVEGKLGDAADVIYNLAQKAKTQGQAIQILSTLSRSTPEGMAAYAQKLFDRKLTAVELDVIKTGLGRVNAASEPAVKLTRMAQLLDQLHGKQGGGAWDEKASGVLNLSMLLNPKTAIRNIGGNLMMATTDLAADVITPAVDAGVSVFTGKRTVGGPQIAEYFQGLAQPGRDFHAGYAQARSEGATRWQSLKEGMDVLAVLGKLGSGQKLEIGDMMKAYRMTFSSPQMRSLEKTMGVVMGSPDRAFYTARFRASLANQMKVTGAAAPTTAMVDQAAVEAARAVYQDKNVISESLRSLRNDVLNYGSTLGRSKRFGLGQVVAPFVQVPGSLLMRGLEYSPAGFVKSLAQTVAPLLPGQKPFKQREFSQAFSKALLGTAGLTATGWMLGDLGIVTGTPDPDPKVRNLQRSLGFGGYQINVSALKRAFVGMDWRTRQTPQAGDVFVNYDWAAPMAFPLAAGASLADTSRRDAQAAGKGKLVDRPSAVVEALLSGSRTLQEQPLLTGLSGFMGDVTDAARSGGSMLDAAYGSMLKLPGQYVPAAVRQVQQLMDNRVYETRGTTQLETAYQSAAANVPGLASALGYKPRSDVLGDMAERYQANGNSFFNVLVNPAFVTRFKDDPEMSELNRIWQQTGESKQIPGSVDSKVTINGQPKVLTATERADYQQFVGRVTRDAFRQLMRNEGYANATDEQRAKVMGQVVSAANTAAKVRLFGDRPRAIDKFDRALLGLSGRDEKLASLGRN